MNRIRILTAITACLFVTLLARADDDEVVQKRIAETVKKVLPAYVFIGGGSGVVISADGYMLTNFHVARDVDSTRVRLPDGRQFVAKRVGIDPAGDITMLKIESDKPLPFVEFGDSDKLEIGQIAIAVGNPHGLGSASRQPSVSVGIVSAFNRSSNYSCSVQTDAAVNPGNSGGPLFDIDGKLIAINGQINTRFGNRVATGTGYSIPINRVKRFMPKFIELTNEDKGRVRRGSIVGLTTTTTAGETQGARVTRVTAGSDAEKFGFKPEDIIVAMDGYGIFSTSRFDVRLATYPAGEKVSMTVLREGKETQIEASLRALIQPFLGIGPDNNATDERGVVVGEVIRGTMAEKAGLKANDIVIEYNGARVRRWEDVTSQIQKGKPNDPFTVKVLRDGKEMVFKGKLGER